jgi:hypothetical protein
MKRWAAAAAVLVGVVCSAAPVGAQPTNQALARGAVVQLAGTPHLFVADEAGVLHWGGDTRGLAGRFVDWGNRRAASLEQLRAYARGDPWLSAGLLKDGDPIYQVKWETEWPTPKLLHIQSIRDVELLGITERNYGAFVLDKAGWERRYGTSSAAFVREPLAAAVQPAAAGRVVASASTTDRYGFVSVSTDADPNRRYVLRVTSAGAAIQFSADHSGGSTGTRWTPWEGELPISDGDRELARRVRTTVYLYAVVGKEGGANTETLLAEIVELPGGAAGPAVSAAAAATPTRAAGPTPTPRPQPAPFVDKDCADFATWREAQAFYEREGGPARDQHGLDNDRDGIACEGLPGAPR